MQAGEPQSSFGAIVLMGVWAVVVAAGSGARFGGAKQFAVIRGLTVLQRSVAALAPHVDGVVVVVPPGEVGMHPVDVAIPVVACAGGVTRSDSVRRGLACVPATAEFVLVHDAARPLVPDAVVRRVIDSVRAGADAVVPAVPVTDTMRSVDGGVVDRSKLIAVQTPQGFRADVLRHAHGTGAEGTDDAGVVESAGGTVTVVNGDPSNLKITTPTDLLIAEALLSARLDLGDDLGRRAVTDIRVGMGFDVHPPSDDPERSLVLGGVSFEGACGLAGHSDADVIAHAATDALLGAAGLGDIGSWFPDTEPALAGADSLVLLAARSKQCVRPVGRRSTWTAWSCSTPRSWPAPPGDAGPSLGRRRCAGDGEGQTNRGCRQPGPRRRCRGVGRGAGLAPCRDGRTGELMSRGPARGPSGPAKRSGPARGPSARSSGPASRSGAPAPKPAKAARSGGAGRAAAPSAAATPSTGRGGGAQVRGRGQRGGQRSGQRGTTPLRSEGSRPRQLGGDQVEGRHAVRELLLAGTRRVREVVLASGMDDAPILDDIVDLCDEQKIKIKEVSKNRFDALARTESAQGVIALAAPLREHDLDELARSVPGQPPPFLILFDGVTDPGNLGAVLRSAECAGVTGVILPRHRSALVSPTVTKTAAGAVEHLPMAVVSGAAGAIARLKELGVWVVGLDASASRSIHDLSVADEPVALVLGSEGSGLSRLARERCDALASIPLLGMLSSLNVAAAGAVACFEVARQRDLRRRLAGA